MKILAIRFARLGDVILLLPALASLKDRFPGCELTLLTGHRCAPIAKLCKAVDRVVSVDRVAWKEGPPLQAMKGMWKLVRDVRRERFDLVIDFHSFRETNLLTWLSGAPKRMGLNRHQAPFWSFCFNIPAVKEDKSVHVAEMFQRVVDGLGDADGRPGSKWTPPASLALGHASSKRRAPCVALYIDAPVQERRWPAENFARVADHIVENIGVDVVAISGAENKDLAERVRKASRNPDRLTIKTNLTLPELVETIEGALLLISNDTGPMHIGPACGIPTLGLFSVGYPEHFRPIGPQDRFLRGNPIEKIEVKDVIQVVEAMWATAAGPGLQR